MSDDELDAIVDMLRECQTDAESSEGDYYADQFAFHGGGEAANAIEWLRAEIARLRLTDAEREAVRTSADAYAANDDDAECAAIAATLRGLLERLA